MTVSSEQISDYLTQYAASLTNFDAQSAVELWSLPGAMVDDRFSGVLSSREDMVQGLEQSYPLYQKLGLGSVDYEVFEEKHLSQALVLVGLRWIFLDNDGQELIDSTSYYLLRQQADRLRACVCIETDAAEKLQALATARGVDLFSPTGE